MKNGFGQYSLVSYVHELRGERVNLGILVWHPRFGAKCRFIKGISRVRTVDEGADLERLRHTLERITKMLSNWPEGSGSPLEKLASEFRHRFIVEAPMNARICDLDFTVERLCSSLLPPEPFARSSTAVQFANAFVSRLTKRLNDKGVKELRTNYSEKDTFQPIKIAAFYKLKTIEHLWRTASFAPLNKPEEQLTLAKAIFAENTEVKSLRKYRNAQLSLAVQMPKPQNRSDWSKSLSWLKRQAQLVEVFEDRQSIEARVAQLA
jgi:hypothetical protein